MKRTIRRTSILIAVSALSALLFRAFPELSSFWADRLIYPVCRALHLFTARVSFPVCEILFIILIACLICGFLRAVLGCIKKAGFLPAARWLTSVFCLAAFLFSSYIYLWYPAYWKENTEASQISDIQHIKWLSEELISELNRESLDFPSTGIILDTAAEISGIEGARIKVVRYPEWMHFLQISGMYIPWTGETVVSSRTPEAALPFTAVHELMHLKGIADEGMANSAAWEICKNAGGAFYTSARLWVLKYALELMESEPDIRNALTAMMNPELYSVFSLISGKSSETGVWAGILPSALGLTGSISSYPDVVKHILNSK